MLLQNNTKSPFAKDNIKSKRRSKAALPGPARALTNQKKKTIIKGRQKNIRSKKHEKQTSIYAY